MTPRQFIPALLVPAAVVLMAGCAPAAPAGSDTPVAVRFAARVGQAPFQCGTSYDGIGSTHSRITPSDFRVYVSQVALIDEQGRAVPLRLDQDGRWQYRDVALLDFENGTASCRNGTPGMHETITGSVPAGRYRGLQFTLGLPADLNHGDPTTAQPPLNLTALFWSWQAGYKFVKVDMATSGQPQGGTVPAGGRQRRAAGFPIHLGSTECVSPSATTAPSVCHRPNLVTVRFDGFDPATQQVEMDLAALLRETDLDVNAPDTAPGCMAAPDDADCRRVLPAFGLPYGNEPVQPQRFFRVAARP